MYATLKQLSIIVSIMIALATFTGCGGASADLSELQPHNVAENLSERLANPSLIIDEKDPLSGHDVVLLLPGQAAGSSMMKRAPRGRLSSTRI